MKYCDIGGFPQLVKIQTETESVVKNSKQGSAEHLDVKVSFAIKDGGMVVSLSAGQTPVKYLALRWNGEFSENVKIFGDALERAYGNLEWRGIVPERCMPWYALVNSGKSTVCYGVKVRPSAFCFWHIDGGGVTLIINVCNGTKGVLLNGRTVNLCEILTKIYEETTAFSAGVEFCKTMCCDGVFPKEKVYGGNNWYYAYGKSLQREIIEDTDYIAKLSEGLSPRPYMVIDDGWQKNVCEGGPWNELNKNFSDMKVLADDIKSRGVKPGIWTRPLFYKADRIPENWILHKFANNNCSLDITVPEAEQYVFDNLKTIRTWGYELIKHDYSTYDIFGKFNFTETDYPEQTYNSEFIADKEWSFSDRTRTNAEIISSFYKLVRKACKDAVIIGCNTVSHLCAGLFEIQRTGDDTSGKSWNRTRLMGFNTLAFRMMQNNIFYTVDADCVGITKAVPWKYNRQWMNLLAKSGSPLFVSSKKGVATKKQVEEIKAAFKTNCKQTESCVPINWQNTVCPTVWSIDGKKVKTYLYQKDGIE